MTPGTAAAPAPGCWLRCLRSMRSGTAAERLLLLEAAKGYEIGKGNAPAPGPNSAYNAASVMRNCAAIAVRGRTRITRVIRIAGPGGPAVR